jgi:hypothetical protein
MTFIPNAPSAAFPDQAEPDSVDFDALLAGHQLTGVITNCIVTARPTPDTTVFVAAGEVMVGGVHATVTGGAVTGFVAHSTNPRFDLVVASSTGVVSRVAGLAAANPVAPTIPATSVLLATVYLPAASTTVVTGQITDKRVLIGTVTDRVITPPTITANQNEYTPTDFDRSRTLRLASDASRNITGLGGAFSVITDGTVKVLLNIGTNDIVLVSESALSTVTRRFALNANMTLPPNGGVALRYDSTSSRWRAYGQAPGGVGVIDHGLLTGLADDDHPQYTTTAESQALVDVHTADPTDAHDASAVSILDSAGDFTATHVEGALAELQSDAEGHLVAADPHTVYQLESAKNAASGYAGLDANIRVPTVRLGSGAASGTTFLRGDQSWAVPPGGGGTGRGLPTTVVKPEEYAAPVTVLLDACDATTGWTTVVHGNTPSLDTTVKTQGTASVKADLWGEQAGIAMIKNFASNQNLGGLAIFSLDLQWSTAGAIFRGFELHISDQPDIANPHTIFKLGDLAEDTWYSPRVWVNGAVRSIGIKKTGYFFFGTSARLTLYIDNVRMEALNSTEVALAAYPKVAVIQEPAYSATQEYLEVPGDRYIEDFHQAIRVYTQGGKLVRQIIGIPGDGSEDVSYKWMWAFNNLEPGERIELPAGAQYWVDSSITIRKLTNFDIRMNNAVWFNTFWSNVQFFLFTDCQHGKVDGLRIFGFKKLVKDGDLLQSIATNMLTQNQYNFEGRSTTGWAAGANTTISALPNVTDSLGGSWLMQLQSVAAGDYSAVTSTGTAGLQVSPSTSYTAKAKFGKPQPYSVRSIRLEINWYDSGGALIGTPSVGTPIVTSSLYSTVRWVEPTITATSPANAAFAALVVKVLAATAALEQMYVDFVTFTRDTARTLTTSGSIIQLTQQGDEAVLPQAPSGLWYHYARDKDLNNVFEFSLDDSAQVPGSAEISIYDARDDRKVLARQSLTLTATPTTYTLTLSPLDDKAPFKVGVRKATTAANTITVRSITDNGRNVYSSAHEGNNGVEVDGKSIDIDFTNAFIEGVGGYCAAYSTRNLDGIRFYDFYFRCPNTQGTTIARGHNMVFDRGKIVASARTGIDVEPYTSDWYVHDMYLGNIEIYNSVNAAISCAAWMFIIRGVIENIRAYDCGLGVLLGGGRGLVVRDISSYGTGPESWDMDLTGQNMLIDNVSLRRGLRLNGGVSSGIIDDQDGSAIVVRSQGNRIRGVRSTDPSGKESIRLSIAAGAGTVEGVGSTIAPLTGNTDIPTPSGVIYYGPANVAGTDAIEGMDFGPYRVWSPNTYKGPAYRGIWFPDGLDMKTEPLLNVRGMSADGTRANNLGRRQLTVAAGATFLDVTFPARAYGQLGGAWSLTASTGGTLPSASYYYRIAARPIDGGPVAALAQKSIFLSVTDNAVVLTTSGYADFVNGYHIAGITIYRGTTSGGPYTTRYDWFPGNRFYAIRSDSTQFKDLGSTLTYTAPDTDYVWGNYPITVPAQSGSWTGTVNETGYEADGAYVVDGIETNWDSGFPWVSAKAASGFRINFPNAAPGDGSGRVSYSLKRLPA